MRTYVYLFSNFILVLVMLALGITGWAQQTRNQHPNASGLSATAQSIPCMSRAQREGLKNPEQGTLVYQTDNAAGYYMNEGTPEQPRWTPVSFGGQMPAPEAVNNGSRAPLSGERGFLPPRLTDAQMNAIAGPAEGLLIYNLTQHKVCMYLNSVWDCSVFSTPYPAGSVHCITGRALVQEVTNPATGDTWMDRNLGASQVATSIDDANAYGDLYQWGRFSDGHQCNTSGTTTTLSSTDDPGHDLFIVRPDGQYDWRSPSNDNLWQGTSGINNPCPSGYRLPTMEEMVAEKQSWSPQNITGAFNSPLHWPATGFRSYQNGGNYGQGEWFEVWSNRGGSTTAYFCGARDTFATEGWEAKASGLPVRCIKD